MRLGTYFKYLFLLALAGFVLLPIWATVLGGFKSTGELRTNPVGLPQVWRFDAYGDILRSPTTWRYALNSLNIAFFTVFLVLVVASMAGVYVQPPQVRRAGLYLFLPPPRADVSGGGGHRADFRHQQLVFAHLQHALGNYLAAGGVRDCRVGAVFQRVFSNSCPTSCSRRRALTASATSGFTFGLFCRCRCRFWRPWAC